SATLPVKSKGFFMAIVAPSESSGAQSTRTAIRSTKYEWQRQASRSRHGVETMETPLARLTSTSQGKHRSRTRHRTPQHESSKIRSSDCPCKKPIQPQTRRKNGAPDQDQRLPIRRHTTSRPTIQRRFPVIHAVPRHRVATRLRTQKKCPKRRPPDRQ